VAGLLPSAAQAESIDTIPPPKSLADLRSLEEKVQRVAAKVLPAVVGVDMGGSQGSGVIVSKDGIVMTAGHVVGKPGQKVKFRFANGKTAEGITLGLNAQIDSGLMRITDKGDWPFVEKGESGNLKIGSWCVTVGHPLGYQPGRPPVVRIGRVLHNDATVLQTDSPIVFGDSGGPVFDLDGKVIGINSRIGGAMDQSLHVPSDAFTREWQVLLSGDMHRTPPAGREDESVKTAFKPVVADADRCVVRVECGGKDAILGTVVGPDGWILTKASELHDKITCRWPDKRTLEARIVGVNPALDLAMLKVDAKELPSASWVSHDPGVGQLVASVGQSDTPLGLGVVSVPRREIAPTPGYIGVQLEDAAGGAGATIKSVVPQGAGDRAGLKQDDIITTVDGTPVKSREECIKIVHKHRPDEAVKVVIKRGKETKDYTITLRKLSTPGNMRRDIMNASTLGLSKRSDAFPAVLQHDTPLKATDCGGPLVDLSGKVVGINIARADRTETYCLPTDILLPQMYDLMSGRLAPPEKAIVEVKPSVEIKKEMKPEIAKPTEKKPEEKKPEEKKAEEKRPDDKKTAQKPEDKKPDVKKVEDKKPEVKAETKPDSAKPEAKKVEEKKVEEKKVEEKKPAEIAPNSKK
jgi:serine protease Do